MNSMKRTVWPVPRKRRAMSRMEPSFRPRLTTTFTLTGSPAAAAASIPASTRATGKSTSFIARKTSSSSESRLTVIRGEAGVGKCLRLLCEERGVRRQGDVESLVERGERGDEVLEIAAQQRLASGDPQLADAELDEDPSDAFDLLEGEELAPREEAVVVPEDLLGHAVDAAEVAAVGDRDAQVAYRATECVDDSHRRESVENQRGAPARPPPRPPRRHGDLGRHVRPGAERDRAVPALRVPRRPVRDLEPRPRAVRGRVAAPVTA